MSNTIAQNLTRLYDAKLAIAEAIESKGGEVQEGDGFEAFAQLIEDLPAGGGNADYNLSGTLTPNNYGTYIFPQNYDWSKTWEIGLVIQKIASSMNSDGFICGSGNVSHGYGCPKFNINDESIGLYAPYSTSSDKDGLGIYFDTPLEQGKAYYIHGGYEGSATNKIYIEMSNDGITYTRLGEKTITFTPIYNSSLSFSLGGIDTGSLIMPKANIPLNTVYIKINGEIVWGKQN